MDVSVLGTGYVGLIQAAAPADVGHRVLCVDSDPNKIRQLQQAVPPISEPGLCGTLEENIKTGRLLFSTQASDAVEYAAYAMLTTRISFRNELANLSDLLGADVEAVRKGIGLRHVVPEALRP
ncbi:MULTISPECIES: hypothetical protein [unclassified Pseudomonas]|uniref:hypothetical protein n=1 Tax=unclassified Pseudomonas TaxID=196821 RepID=UPI002114F49A|nr:MULTISPECIES: hypothetical protein [unclassified Pseudomonas]